MLHRHMPLLPAALTASLLACAAAQAQQTFEYVKDGKPQNLIALLGDTQPSGAPTRSWLNTRKTCA